MLERIKDPNTQIPDTISGLREGMERLHARNWRLLVGGRGIGLTRDERLFVTIAENPDMRPRELKGEITENGILTNDPEEIEIWKNWLNKNGYEEESPKNTELKTSKDKQIDPEKVKQAFKTLIEEQQVNGRGRKPVRVERIWSVFRGRENDSVPIEKLIDAFSETKDPYNSAQTALSWINKAFERLGSGIEIERGTIYHIRNRH